MAIKFIVQTFSSEIDRNGNRYHFARITHTRTRRSLVLREVGGESNAPAHVKRLLDCDWSEIFAVQSTEKKRDWSEMRKVASHARVVLWEHELSARHLRDLSRPACVACGETLRTNHECKE